MTHRIGTCRVGVDDVAYAVREDGSGAWLGPAGFDNVRVADWTAVPWVRPFHPLSEPRVSTPRVVNGVDLDTMTRLTVDPTGAVYRIPADPEDL